MARHFGLDCVSNGIGFFVGVEEAAYGGDGFDHIARIRDPVLIFDTGHSGMCHFFKLSLVLYSMSSFDNPSLNLDRIREDALAEWDKCKEEEEREQKRKEEEEQKKKEAEWAKYLPEIERILKEEYPKAVRNYQYKPTAYTRICFETSLETRTPEFAQAFTAYCAKQGYRTVVVFPTKDDIPVSIVVSKKRQVPDSPGCY
jgi:hypothetical protein